jgi:hypothetical protein
MSLYKYVSAGVLSHLLDGKIRFTQPSAFNDPFQYRRGRQVMDAEVNIPVAWRFVREKPGLLCSETIS